MLTGTAQSRTASGATATLVLQCQRLWRGQPSTWPTPSAEPIGVMVTGRLRQRSWETPEGDKWSVTELEADEVGVSLKWATAKVERSSQRGDGEAAWAGSGRPSGAATSTTRPDLLNADRSPGSAARTVPGCRQVGPQTPLPLSLTWLENVCAVLPAPDREWLHRGLPWAQSRPALLGLFLPAPRERPDAHHHWGDPHKASHTAAALDEHG
jgi:hypothetical protein